jgi:tRNA(Ile)-lysidine synthase
MSPPDRSTTWQPAPDRADPVVTSLASRTSFPSRREVDLAVSGGPDSTALLALALATGHHPVVHHVDHGVRLDSGADADAVEALCDSWGVEVVVHRVAVAAGADQERRCREARLSVLPPDTLFGHTADDLAETVLLRMLRGTGPGGLAAMSERNHPLLGLRRADTVGLCAHLGLDPRHDTTNDDPRFVRNRVRREVLPLLHDVAGRDVVPLLCRLAELAGEREALVEELVEPLDPSDSRSLEELSEPVAREVLRRWWRAETGLLPPDRAATARMLAVARGRVRSCDVVEGWRLERTERRLRLVPPR